MLQVAVWHPTLCYPIDFANAFRSAEFPTQPTEQLQMVETEKCRLQLQGIEVADETTAFTFFKERTARTRAEQATDQARNMPVSWDPDQAAGGLRETEQYAGPTAMPVEQQLQQLAQEVTLALPGTRQQQLSRMFHPETALSTILVELRPLEDIAIEEQLLEAKLSSSSDGSVTRSKERELRPTARVHFRYARDTVFRLLPLVVAPSSTLLESLQHCHQGIVEALEAHRKNRWTKGDDVFFVAPAGNEQLPAGSIGLLESSPSPEASHLYVRVSSWQNEPPELQLQLEDACRAICPTVAVRQCSLPVQQKEKNISVSDAVWLKRGSA